MDVDLSLSYILQEPTKRRIIRRSQEKKTSKKVRQAQMCYEKEICLKAKDDPKVFCRFVQCKAKIKESIQCIIDDNGEIHTENNCKVELLNAILQCFYK